MSKEEKEGDDDKLSTGREKGVLSAVVGNEILPGKSVKIGVMRHCDVKASKGKK